MAQLILNLYKYDFVCIMYLITYVIRNSFVRIGVYVLMSGLDLERIVFSSAPIGIMQACMDVVIPYVRQREQFGKPIGEYQFIQVRLLSLYLILGH